MWGDVHTSTEQSINKNNTVFSLSERNHDVLVGSAVFACVLTSAVRATPSLFVTVGSESANSLCYRVRDARWLQTIIFPLDEAELHHPLLFQAFTSAPAISFINVAAEVVGDIQGRSSVAQITRVDLTALTFLQDPTMVCVNYRLRRMASFVYRIPPAFGMTA